MNEKKIDELLEERMNISEEEQTEMNKKIQSGIARTVYSRVLIVLTALAVLLGAGWYGISKYQEAASFHIRDLEPIIDETVIDGTDYTEIMTAYDYLALYYELFAPGYRMGFNNRTALEKVENGVYAYHAVLFPWFHVNAEGVPSPRISIESRDLIIRDGKHIPDEEPNYVMIYRNYFKRWIAAQDTWNRNRAIPAIQNEIEELPSSAFVELNISFADPISLEKLLEVCSGLTSSRLSYAVTHLYMDTENNYSITPLGISFINPTLSGKPLTYNIDDNPYPYLQVKEDCARQDLYHGADYSYNKQFSSAQRRRDYAEEMTTHYESVLKLMISSQFLGEEDEKVVSYAYNDMQENELKIYGIQIFCAKDDALKALNLDNIKNMQIEDIKMSRFD